MGKKMVVQTTCPVECPDLGGVYFFRPPDKALSKAMPLFEQVRQQKRRALTDTLGRLPTEDELGELNVDLNDNSLPDGMMEAVCDMFTEGVITWRDVEDEDGNPLPCNEANKRMIPTEAKWVIVFAYLEQRKGVEEKKAPSAAPPMNCTLTEIVGAS